MKYPTFLRTADILAVWDAIPTAELRPAEIADALGVRPITLSGHLDWLRKCSKVERVRRGVYRRTAFGERAA